MHHNKQLQTCCGQILMKIQKTFQKAKEIAAYILDIIFAKSFVMKIIYLIYLEDIKFKNKDIKYILMICLHLYGALQVILIDHNVWDQFVCQNNLEIDNMYYIKEVLTMIIEARTNINTKNNIVEIIKIIIDFICIIVILYLF